MGYKWQASSMSAGAAQALWCLTLLATVQWTAVANVEVDALNAFRQALSDPSQVLQSWDPSSFGSPCTWFHVTCNADNHVIRVDLGNASLSGSLVPQLGELSSLQYLELHSNNISGPIPASIGNLSQLVSLDLYQNALTGAIPASLGHLGELRFFRLNDNSLSGAIPESLTGLTNLELLDFSYNNLSGYIPVNGSFSNFTYESFEGNPNLHYPPAPANVEVDALHALRQALSDPSQVLQSWDPSLDNPCTWFHITCNADNHVIRVDLGDASLSGSLVPQLGELSYLQYLELFRNNISGPIPASIGNLSQLVSLDLYQNALTGAIPPSLGHLQHLAFLRLNNNSLSGEIPESIGDLAQLVSLDLDENALTGAIPPSLGHLHHLAFLRLNNNSLSGDIPESIGDLAQLVSLDLNQNALSGAIPPSLGHLYHLAFLRLNNNSLDGEIPESLTGLTNLEVVDLSYNYLSGYIPVNGSFSNFTYESFEGNPNLHYAPAPANVEVDALHALRQALDDPSQVLESWDPSSLSPCTWFHVTCNADNHVIRVDLGDAYLSGSLVPQLGELSSLQYLELFRNNISGEIPASIGNLSQLVSLDLYQNALTGAIPASLGHLCELRFLRLNNNSLSGAIPESLTGLTNLEVVDLSYNNLSGYIPVNGSFSNFTYASFEGNPNLHYAAAPAPALAPSWGL